MNKIGILTYQNTLNYGAMLQAYALCKYINNCGVKCEVINYHNKKIEEDEFKYTYINFSSIKNFFNSLMLHNLYKSKKNKFQSFYKENVNNSKEHYYRNTISNVEKIYDKIIVGSDQVWNMNLNGEDYTYMLDNISKKEIKNSYAASFGYSNIPNKYKNKCEKFLNNFNTLYVREKSGENIIQDLCNKKAYTTIDPTFLLSKNDWKKLCKNKYKKKYIFVYMVDFKKNIKSIVEFAKQNNAEVITITESKRKYKDVIYLRDASPEEFVDLINNAFCIITGSFHAVSLSINLEKDFYYLNNLDGKSTRVKNILEISNLLNREIVTPNVKFERIDYNNLDNKLSENIDFSKERLKLIIKN